MAALLRNCEKAPETNPKYATPAYNPKSKTLRSRTGALRAHASFLGFAAPDDQCWLTVRNGLFFMAPRRTSERLPDGPQDFEKNCRRAFRKGIPWIQNGPNLILQKLFALVIPGCTPVETSPWRLLGPEMLRKCCSDICKNDLREIPKDIFTKIRKGALTANGHKPQLPKPQVFQICSCYCCGLPARTPARPPWGLKGCQTPGKCFSDGLETAPAGIPKGFSKNEPKRTTQKMPKWPKPQVFQKNLTWMEPLGFPPGTTRPRLGQNQTTHARASRARATDQKKQK